MGTNFYAIRKIDSTKKEHLNSLLDSERWNDLLEELSECLDKIHIGKRSCEWAFLFQARGKYVDVPWDSLDELKEFLKRDDVYIEDEYGTRFTFDEFWDSEIGDLIYPSDRNIDMVEYCKKHSIADRSGEEIRDGVRWSSREFF